MCVLYNVCQLRSAVFPVNLGIIYTRRQLKNQNQECADVKAAFFLHAEVYTNLNLGYSRELLLDRLDTEGLNTLHLFVFSITLNLVNLSICI